MYRHVQIIVKKILSLNPDVILVGNNVSKHAIDLFLQVGILVITYCHSRMITS